MDDKFLFACKLWTSFVGNNREFSCTCIFFPDVLILYRECVKAKIFVSRGKTWIFTWDCVSVVDFRIQIQFTYVYTIKLQIRIYHASFWTNSLSKHSEYNESVNIAQRRSCLHNYISLKLIYFFLFWTGSNLTELN
jgi:hypothetical protein